MKLFGFKIKKSKSLKITKNGVFSFFIISSCVMLLLTIVNVIKWPPFIKTSSALETFISRPTGDLFEDGSVVSYVFSNDIHKFDIPNKFCLITQDNPKLIDNKIYFNNKNNVLFSPQESIVESISTNGDIKTISLLHGGSYRSVIIGKITSNIINGQYIKLGEFLGSSNGNIEQYITKNDKLVEINIINNIIELK